jgi:hypothetical protein
MKQSPIYSSLLFIFKHCIKSITAAKPAEAMDGSPKQPGREQNVQILLAYRCNSPSSLLRHNPPEVLVRVSRDFAIEVRLNILTNSGAELGKYAGRGKLNGFGKIHGTSFHGLGIEYLTSFSQIITGTIRTPKAIKYSPPIKASNLKVTVHPSLYSAHNRD